MLVQLAALDTVFSGFETTVINLIGTLLRSRMRRSPHDAGWKRIDRPDRLVVHLAIPT